MFCQTSKGYSTLVTKDELYLYMSFFKQGLICSYVFVVLDVIQIPEDGYGATDASSSIFHVGRFEGHSIS
jgi:hypothetical protein